MKSDLKKSGKIRGKNTKLKNKRPEKSKSEDLWSDSCGARRLRGYSPSPCRAPETTLAGWVLASSVCGEKHGGWVI